MSQKLFQGAQLLHLDPPRVELIGAETLLEPLHLGLEARGALPAALSLSQGAVSHG